GPAKLGFRRLWTAADDASFERGDQRWKPTETESQGPGEIYLTYQGREDHLKVSQFVEKWKRIGSTSLEARVDRYLPYAIVRDGELVNKSNDPVNPAIQVKLRNPLGVVEQHTAFANFPDFETLHGRAKIKVSERLGARLRFVASSPSHSKMAFIGSNRGML